MPNVDFSQADFFPLDQIHVVLGRERPYCWRTLKRWRDDGLHGSKLRTWKLGQTRMTSRAAVAEFLEGQNRGAAK